MNPLKYQADQNLVIYLSGSLNAQNSNEIAQQIQQIRMGHPELKLILNLSELSYLSSSGIRVFMNLMKREKGGIELEDVPLEIWDILDMTGLSEIIPMSRKKRVFSVENMKKIGAGGVGAVYKADQDTLVKTFYQGVDISEAEKELKNARKVFVEGIPTAIPFDIVKISEGGFGVVYELLNSNSALQSLQEKPEKAQAMGKNYGQFMAQSHTIEPAAEFMDQKAFYLNLLEGADKYLGKEQKIVFENYLNSIPSTRQFSHGDLHPGNVLYQKDEPMMIDLATIGVGHPVFDLVSLYAFLITKTLLEANEGFIDPRSGLDLKTARTFFESVLEGYFTDRSAKERELIAREIDRFNPLRNALLYTYFFKNKPLPDGILDMFERAYQNLQSDPVFHDWQ